MSHDAFVLNVYKEGSDLVFCLLTLTSFSSFYYYSFFFLSVKGVKAGQFSILQLVEALG